MGRLIKYFDYNLCKECGGNCCKRSEAGIYHPNDFKEKITKEFILTLIQNGNYGIDWWEGDPQNKHDKIYYIRPRHKNEEIIYGSWTGRCIHFNSEIGCVIAESERPYQCKKLIPKEDGKCYYLSEDKGSRWECIERWYEYQNEIQEAIKLYRNK